VHSKYYKTFQMKKTLAARHKPMPLSKASFLCKHKPQAWLTIGGPWLLLFEDVAGHSFIFIVVLSNATDGGCSDFVSPGL
jgi:hypothetical protein